MHQGRTTLSKFLIQQLKGTPEQSDLAALLVEKSCKTTATIKFFSTL